MTSRDTLLSFWDEIEVSREALWRAAETFSRSLIEKEDDIYAPLHSFVLSLDMSYVRRVAASIKVSMLKVGPEEFSLQYAAMTDEAAVHTVVREGSRAFLEQAEQLLIDNNLPGLDEAWD